jgi:flavin reductase (DIM6/NTAB) family NADH-FMN oxidoreductase RutF
LLDGSNAMPPSTTTVTFDFAALSGHERYKLLIGAVVPRPIALVTTVDSEGRVNAAPFSFFNCLSADPAILALGVEYRASGPQKDTGRNVRDTQCFTVNIVSDAILEAMNICAVPFEPGINELKEAGLTAAAGVKVACPWIAEAPAAFECRHHTTLGIGKTREIILGEVLFAHFRQDVVDRMTHHVDPEALDAVGRMGGHGYASTRDHFDLPTMTVEAWRTSGMPPRIRTADAGSAANGATGGGGTGIAKT